MTNKYELADQFEELSSAIGNADLTTPAFGFAKNKLLLFAINRGPDIVAALRNSQQAEATTMTKNPPAFPKADSGMTLRDHFAGQLMASLVTSAEAIDIDEGILGLRLAHNSYMLADAMLVARKEHENAE